MTTTIDLLGFADIEDAAARIASVCVRTPLLESPAINGLLGGRLFLKAENLQTTGSFKLRGALNRLAALTPYEREKGVAARSSGNHGLAIAHCARLLKLRAVVIAPRSAPRAKIDRIASLGTEIVLVDDIHRLAAVADRIVRDRNLVLVPSADDPWIVAGAGTVGLEVVEQAHAARTTLDALLVGCSGGGLTTGCVVALDTMSPTTSVVAVEPAGFAKMARSLAAGRRIDNTADNTPAVHTICDALSGPYTAALPFEIVRDIGMAPPLAVTDAEVRHAMRVAFAEFGLSVEPGGAAALAAVLSGRFPLQGRSVAVVLSGRNVDADLAGAILGGA